MLLYRILDGLIDSIFPVLEVFEYSLDDIDKTIFNADPKNTAMQISFLRRNVIFFQSIIKPELVSFQQIHKNHHDLIDRDLRTYFTNITDHLNKIWDRLEDLIELTNNLSKTFESYLTFKTNEVIKILTIFSVVMMPLTLLASVYGMNLAFLPMSDHPYAIFIIAAFMFSLVVIMFSYFKHKKWV
jgi:magnesium transporter